MNILQFCALLWSTSWLNVSKRLHRTLQSDSQVPRTFRTWNGTQSCQWLSWINGLLPSFHGRTLVAYRFPATTGRWRFQFPWHKCAANDSMDHEYCNSFCLLMWFYFCHVVGRPETRKAQSICAKGNLDAARCQGLGELWCSCRDLADCCNLFRFAVLQSFWLNRLPQSIAHCRQITLAQHFTKSWQVSGATRELQNCTFLVSLLIGGFSQPLIFTHGVQHVQWTWKACEDSQG